MADVANDLSWPYDVSREVARLVEARQESNNNAFDSRMSVAKGNYSPSLQARCSRWRAGGIISSM